MRKVFDLSVLPHLPADVRCRSRCHYRDTAFERIKEGPAGKEMGVDLCDFDVRLTTVRPASQERKQSCRSLLLLSFRM